MNTIFAIESEGIRFCHLGDLATSLDKKQLEEVNGVDILGDSSRWTAILSMEKKPKPLLIRSNRKIVLLDALQNSGDKAKIGR